MVQNLATNYVSPQFHVVYDEKFSTIQNDTRLQDSTIEAIFEKLFTKCRDFYGEESRPPELPVAASEGATVEDPPQELGGEWLTEAERRDKRARTIKWQEKQHEIRKQQAKEMERLNNDLTPVWPLDGDVNKPRAFPVSDSDDSSIDSDDRDRTRLINVAN